MLAALRLAQAHVAVTRTQLDADPRLLACPNGTLDLERLELRPHRREDLITMVTAARYDAGARHPAPGVRPVPRDDPEVRAFVQRVAGYG